MEMIKCESQVCKYVREMRKWWRQLNMRATNYIYRAWVCGLGWATIDTIARRLHI
jgi:hypothetical protein